MATSMNYVVFMCMFAAASLIGYVVSSSSSFAAAVSTSECRLQSNTFIDDLQFRCPVTISSSSPIQMDGESLNRALSSSQSNMRTAVLYYASWCPFSIAIQTKFADLSIMFPQIKHVMVEQSSVMPSVLSRYGIHSLPSMLMINRTTRAQYHGPKDIQSFVHFYKRTTGLDPEMDLTEDQGRYAESGSIILNPWKENSVREILRREPYLVFSALFVLLRVFLYFFPEIISRLRVLWFTCVPHLNVGIFGESRQLLGRVLHLIDVKRVWSKMKLCKTRNFHNRAQRARVWASSLASVSLGETSSARTITSGDS